MLYLLTPPCDQRAYIIMYRTTNDFSGRHCLKYCDPCLYTSATQVWVDFAAECRRRCPEHVKDVEAYVKNVLDGVQLFTIMCGADEVKRGCLTVHTIEGDVRKVTKCDE